MNSWSACKNILCIRADNMGDVIMSGPAMRALKESFHCTITLLTSSMGSVITGCIPEIDDVLICNLPWIKANETLLSEACLQLIADIKKRHFDAAVIFTAYSQSALPAAMLAFLAGIPLRLAWCRENPYELLTNWVPDKEPYSVIRHQVQRDLDLVASVGAHARTDHLLVEVKDPALQSAFQKLSKQGIDIQESWIIVHTGVSEKKREYPLEQWIQTVRLLQQHFDLPVLLTGSASEMQQAKIIQQATGKNVHVVAGLFTIEEFIAVVHEAQLVISVNTATVHIAAATDTPVVVLYALTNPQHTPWNAYTKVLPFPVQDQLKSKNEVITYVSNKLFAQQVSMPTPANILQAAHEILEGNLEETVKEQAIISL
jgi:ADP-heptose:LPS heptosyltransferase